MSITEPLVDAPGARHRAGLVSPFVRDGLPGRVVFGEGALDQIAAETDRLGRRRVLLVGSVHTPGEKSANDRVAALLGSRVVGRWDDIRQHVPVDLVDAAAACADEVAADLLVSVGGGSATGLGKALALRGRPLLAVPTTYAGSEMTPVYGLTEGGRKTTARDMRVLPKTVVYDPELLRELPPEVVGPSGMNALAHCAEALYAPLADPQTSLLALEGSRLLARSLGAAYRDGDSGSRGDVLWASCLAGQSFAVAGGSLHHSLCHLLGGRHDLPHADTHAIVLPYVLGFLGSSIAPALGTLGAAFAVPPEQVPEAVWQLGTSVGAGGGLRRLGLARDALPALVDELIARDPHSPRPLDHIGISQLLLAAWGGDQPQRVLLSTGGPVQH